MKRHCHHHHGVVVPELTAKLQLPPELLALLKQPKKAAAPGNRKPVKPQRKRLQQQISEAIIADEWPKGVPQQMPRSHVENRLADKWSAKCDKFGLPKNKRPTPPKWGAVDRLLKRAP
jgi:hypothetical protein